MAQQQKIVQWNKPTCWENFIALQKNSEQPNAGVPMPKQKLLITSQDTVREEQRTK